MRIAKRSIEVEDDETNTRKYLWIGEKVRTVARRSVAITLHSLIFQLFLSLKIALHAFVAFLSKDSDAAILKALCQSEKTVNSMPFVAVDTGKNT